MTAVPAVPAPVRLMLLDALIDADVTLTPTVVPDAEVPAAIPPLPAQVLAKLFSCPTAFTVSVFPVRVTLLPIYARVTVSDFEVELATPAATIPPALLFASEYCWLSAFARMLAAPEIVRTAPSAT